jgi:hypothetical protein
LVHEIPVDQVDPIREVPDVPEVRHAEPADEPVDVVALGDQELRKIGAILAGYTGYQGALAPRQMESPLVVMSSDFVAATDRANCASLVKHSLCVPRWLWGLTLQRYTGLRWPTLKT